MLAILCSSCCAMLDLLVHGTQKHKNTRTLLLACYLSFILCKVLYHSPSCPHLAIVPPGKHPAVCH